MSEDLQTDVSKMSDVEKYNYELALKFASAQIIRLKQLNMSDRSDETVSFSDVNKEDLLSYLKSPKSSEKNIRNASISMYHASSHYKRLILYYALMPTWNYIIKPVGYIENKSKLQTSYIKAAEKIESMNLKHEMQKVLTIGLREGVFYGVIWESSSGGSFYIQKINPDWCKITSLVDGTWVYSVDMTKIKDADLYKYPPEFTEMFNQYKVSGNKWQEVPAKKCFCFKADETSIEYSLPPWAAVMPSLLDVEHYKNMQETSNDIANYKLINMKIPLDSTNAPKFNFEMADKYYKLLCSELPPFVGAVMSPMELSDFDFDKNGSLTGTDIVERAERQFWQNSGTSPLLFGDAANSTAGALKFSIKADEEIVFGWVAQIERIVNRLLRNLSGNIKFKISFLPTTVFNLSEMIGLYKDASTLGIPVKSSYASALGVNTLEIPSMDYIERELLGMNNLVPLSSGYNVSSEENGRPRKDDTELSRTGNAMREELDE